MKEIAFIFTPSLMKQTSSSRYHYLQSIIQLMGRPEVTHGHHKEISIIRKNNLTNIIFDFNLSFVNIYISTEQYRMTCRWFSNKSNICYVNYQFYPHSFFSNTVAWSHSGNSEHCLILSLFKARSKHGTLRKEKYDICVYIYTTDKLLASTVNPEKKILRYRWRFK